MTCIYIVGEGFPGQPADKNSGTIGPGFPCFDANTVNMLRARQMQNVGIISSTWPLIIIVGRFFILLHLISVNLHFEGLRNM